MATIETKTTKASATKTPSSKTDLVDQEPKPSTEMARVISDEVCQMLHREPAKFLTSVQIERTVAVSCPQHKGVDSVLKDGAQGLVDEFAATDAVESTLAPVIVGIRNAVMTGLYAATIGSAERRYIELQTALKGASVLAQLLEAFDSHRGNGNRRVTVGNVNVESGAQAIVGNVEATPRQEPRFEDTGGKANKHKPRAA
jgi:hypothetical protein